MAAVSMLIIAGSEREGSLNRRLASVAATLARKAGHEARPLDLRALALPLYDGDIEARTGVPAGVSSLLEAVRSCDAVLIVTPEYNGFPTPLVINAFDWLSRLQATGERPGGLAATANKPVGLLAASPGPLGGLRSMNLLRQYLQMAFAMIVVPQQFALGRAHEAFDEAGALKDAKAVQSVENVLRSLAHLAAALRPG